MVTRRRLLTGASLGIAWAAIARSGDDQEEKIPPRIFAHLRFESDPRSIGVYAINPDEGTWVKIDDDDHRMNSFARISPDGKWIAWLESNRAGGYSGVFVRETAGGDARLVTEKAGRIGWSPDGGELIVSMNQFAAVETKAEVGTWRVDVKSGRATKLPIPKAVQVIDWSIDGKTLLAFDDEARKEKSPEERPLFTLDLQGENRHDLSTDGGVAFHQSFAPDGKCVICNRYEIKDDRLSSMESWSIAADGSKRERILNHLAGDIDPFHSSLSPDGKRFAIVPWHWTRAKDGSKLYDNQPADLFVVDRDGKVPRKIELPPTTFIRLMDWR